MPIPLIVGAAIAANEVRKKFINNPGSLEEVLPCALDEKLKKLNLEDLPQHIPRVMMHELIMVALCDGEISENKMMLLKQVQNHFGIDDESFQDLLEQGKILRKQLDRSTYIILE